MGRERKRKKEAAGDPARTTRAGEPSWDEALALQRAGKPGPALVALERLARDQEGLAAHPETLRLTVNGRILWQRGSQEPGTAGWRYLSLPYTADAPSLTLRIERQAVSPVIGSVVAVRNLHLFPTY